MRYMLIATAALLLITPALAEGMSESDQAIMREAVERMADKIDPSRERIPRPQSQTSAPAPRNEAASDAAVDAGKRNTAQGVDNALKKDRDSSKGQTVESQSDKGQDNARQDNARQDDEPVYQGARTIVVPRNSYISGGSRGAAAPGRAESPAENGVVRGFEVVSRQAGADASAPIPGFVEVEKPNKARKIASGTSQGGSATSR